MPVIILPAAASKQQCLEVKVTREDAAAHQLTSTALSIIHPH